MVQERMIESERLLLRPYREDDFEELHAMTSDVRVLQYLGSSPSTREESWARLLRNIGHWTVKNYGALAIFEKASGRYVGNTGLAHYQRGLGDQFDADKLEAYPPGSVIVLPGNTSHFHWAKSSEYVTQVTGTGPLGLEYIDAKNDPRTESPI